MDLSLKALEEAVGIRRQISALEKRLASLFGTSSSNSSTPAGRRRLSAATRAKLAAAGRARWAKHKGGKTMARAKKPKRKSGLTPAGRRKLSQLMKARWAAKRKEVGKK